MDEDLSDEDLALKQQLELYHEDLAPKQQLNLYLERFPDPDPGFHKVPQYEVHLLDDQSSAATSVDSARQNLAAALVLIRLTDSRPIHAATPALPTIHQQPVILVRRTGRRSSMSTRSPLVHHRSRLVRRAARRSSMSTRPPRRSSLSSITCRPPRRSSIIETSAALLDSIIGLEEFVACVIDLESDKSMTVPSDASSGGALGNWLSKSKENGRRPVRKSVKRRFGSKFFDR